MNEYAYRPGTWQIVVDAGGAVAVPADVPLDRLETLNRMLRDGAPQLTDLIDVLSGGSIAALGSFAVVLTAADAVRLAVRGPVSVRVNATAGHETVSGEEITTWTERFIAGVRDFEVVVAEAAGETWYPIRSGVVLGAGVRSAGRQPEAPETRMLTHESPGTGTVTPATVKPETLETEIRDPHAPETENPGSDPREADPHAVEPDAENAGDTPDIHTLIPAELTYGTGADGDTVLTAATAALAPPPPPPPPSLGDHDGSTISLAEMRRRRDDSAESESAAPDAPTEVMSAVAPPSPAHGVVRLSTGQVVELDRTVIIGRRPRSTRASGETMPHLVAVDSPQQDISRSHLEIRPEGDSVVVIDLHTTNGSTLLRPGADPVRLHPGEHTLVLTGDVVDLGDGVTVSFEGLT